MNPKLILHIGHGKTGTSYIQSTLALNIDNLKKYNIHYPLHKSFSSAVKGLTTSGNGNLIFNPKFTIDQTTLLSDEGLCYRLSIDDNFKRFVQRHNCDLEIILYTRNVVEMLASRWGQYIKTGLGVLSFDEFISADKFNSYETVLWWVEASKKFNFTLKLRNYSSHKSSLINVFYQDLLNAPVDFDIILPETKIINRSMTISELKLQTAFNRFFKESGSFISSALIKKLPNIESEQPIISQMNYDKLYKRYNAVINKINSFIDPNEKIIIEGYLKYNSNGTRFDDSEYNFNQDQIEVIAEALANEQSFSNVISRTIQSLIRGIKKKKKNYFFIK